jgi:hypothetical protein
MFNFKIENYTISELRDMFGLPLKYDAYMLDEYERKIKEKIEMNCGIDEETREQTLLFIKRAKKELYDNSQTPLADIRNGLSQVYNMNPQMEPVKVSMGNVQERPTTPYISSLPSEYYQGIINPLKKRITKKNLNIDTRFRENYYAAQATNFHMDLPLKMSNVVSMKLSAFEMPSSFYVISKQFGNNFFSFTYDSTTITVDIPDGTYTNSSLIDTINAHITQVAPNTIIFHLNVNSATDTSGSGQVLVGIDPAATFATFTLNFQADHNGNADQFTPLPLKLGWMLGFRNGIYANNSTYISEGVIEVSGPRYMYLVVDDYNNNVNNIFYSAFTSSILNKNILARISFKDAFLDTVKQNNLSIITTAREYYGPVDIQKLNIQLLDEYGRILDINNMDYSFCLTLETLYDM